MRLVITLVAATAALVMPSAAAAARDRDHDGLPDRWERRHHLSTKRNSANTDLDRDGVDNRNEHRERTKPRDRDSDDDRLLDGLEDRDRDGLANAAEDLSGNDPRDADTDDDGLGDGAEHVGVIASVDGLAVTIQLATGASVTGLVTEDTDLLCSTEVELEAEHDPTGRRARATSGDGDLPDESDDGEDEDEVDDEDELDDEGELEDEYACPPDALAPGTPVHQAELSLTQAGVVLDELELVR
jgi:hypothetical protein